MMSRRKDDSNDLEKKGSMKGYKTISKQCEVHRYIVRLFSEII